jgi:outer membrane receptor protein involved in Fe transport
MMPWRGRIAPAVVGALLAVTAARADDPPAVRLPELDVVSQQLDQERSTIEPSLGASRYDFTPAALAAIPQGANAGLNQVLLQAPGVAQDSFGQLHVRGDHNEVQYRLDGVQLPEGLSVFGQALQSRFASSLSLITGALPAQYGFLQAAVVDITTKSGTTDQGGEISLYGGTRGTLQPSVSYGGRRGAVDYFVTGDFLQNRIGIENPTDSFNAIHDQTFQYHGLAHISGLVDATTRISLIAGVSNDRFQIPDNPNQTPLLGSADSSTLNENQREVTDFAILSLQKHLESLDVTTSVFSRASSLYYSPDMLGDLLFNGIAQTASRSVVSTGTQSDASWRVAQDHTIRAGFQAQIERGTSSSGSQVLATSGQPQTINQGSGKTGGLYGLYLQDEWKITAGLTLNYGARFDLVDEFSTGNQISPRINLVYTPIDGTTLHVGYSRYFTPPPFELVSAASVGAFANTSAAPQVTQDSIVKPERDHYFDVGVDQVILPGLRAGIDAYYKLATNLIDEGQFGAPIILTAFNYAQGEVGGVEFSSSYDHGPLSLYANFATSRAIGKDIDSAQFNFSASDLAYISQHWIYLDHNQTFTGSAGVAYTVNPDTPYKLRLSADLIAGSGLRADGAVPNGRSLPGYGTVNFSAVQNLNLGIQLRLDVINLLDRVYEIRDGTGVGVGAPQSGLRRTILAGVAQRF